jgi:predicted ester cyclase
MSVDANKTIVRRLFEEVWNNGNLAVIDEISDAAHAAYERPAVTIWRTAFPDLYITIDDMIAEGDKVAAEVTFRGTHQGELAGELIRWLTPPLPPTGKRVEMHGMYFYRVADGRLVGTDSRTVVDSLALLRGLGVLPSP